MRKSLQWSQLLTLASVLFLFSCKKSDVSEEKAPAVEKRQSKVSAFINEAKQSFLQLQNRTARNQRNAVPKSVIWDRAYTSTYKKRKAVIAPLEFEKQLAFQTSFNPEKKNLSNHARLYMYKDSTGNFQTEVVYFFPEKLDAQTSVRFSGLIKVEDWNGNDIKAYRFRDNKIYRLQAKEDGRSSASGRVMAQQCYYIDWYDCVVDDFGNAGDCYLIGSQFLGCEEAGQNEEETDWINNDDLGGGASYESVTMPELNVSNSISSITTDLAGTTRTRHYKWIFLKGLGLTFTSYEKSTQQYAGGEWKFVDIKHQETKMTGLYAGWNISHSITGLVEYAGIYNASVEFDADVTFTTSVFRYPITRIAEYSVGNIFGINDGN